MNPARNLLLLASFTLLDLHAAPAPAPAITIESNVPPYTLPDPLVCVDGSPVRDANTWRTKRRPELLELFATHEYGRTPAGRPPAMHWAITAVDRAALGGKATRKEVTIWFTAEADGPQMRLLIYQPNGVTSPPVFLGLNFFGNHTVNADPAITLAQPFVFYEVDRYRPAPPGTPATSEQRGVHASKWQIETVIARGYATATAWCNDLCPDRGDSLLEGVPALFKTGSSEERRDDAWGALGAWGWGLSRALDYIESDRELDARRVAVHGFSRLGKAADWAAAQDERFAMLVSFESGEGGAALGKRLYGETVAIINGKFFYWFAKNFRKYNDNEAALPVDQHELMALIAPRPLYVASADGDQWSDPRGEFLGAKGAEPVYRLFGKAGIGVDEMPGLNAPVGGTIGYHNRTGKHDVTDYDWACVLDFADRQLKPKPRK